MYPFFVELTSRLLVEAASGIPYSVQIPLALLVGWALVEGRNLVRYTDAG